MRTSAAWVAGLALMGLGATGCRQQGEMPADSATDGANAASSVLETTRPAETATPAAPPEDANTQAADGAPDNASGGGTKSILRPDVAPPEPAPPPLEPITRTIAFGASGLALDDPGRRMLDDLLHQPATAAGGRIVLRGNTDSRGSDSANLIVSRRMAEAVRDYLVKHGIDRERISVIALGERRPVAPNAHADGSDDPEGRARNRRVEIEVLLPDTPARPEPES
ncbi:MAG: OmpA family protein [Sphingomonas bacterium]